MIRYYFIPAETTPDPVDGEPDTHPKYVMGLGVNWASVHIPAENAFVVIVNTKASLNSAHGVLASKPDVISMDGSRGNKDALRTRLNLGRDIRDNEDEVEVVARLAVPDFVNDRDHLFVSE